MRSEKPAKCIRMRTSGFAPRWLPDGSIVGCNLEDYIKLKREMIRGLEKKHSKRQDQDKGSKSQSGAGEGKQKRQYHGSKSQAGAKEGKQKKTPGEKRQCKSPARWQLKNCTVQLTKIKMK